MANVDPDEELPLDEEGQDGPVAHVPFAEALDNPMPSTSREMSALPIIEDDSRRPELQDPSLPVPLPAACVPAASVPPVALPPASKPPTSLPPTTSLPPASLPAESMPAESMPASSVLVLQSASSASPLDFLGVNLRGQEEPVVFDPEGFDDDESESDEGAMFRTKALTKAKEVPVPTVSATKMKTRSQNK